MVATITITQSLTTLAGLLSLSLSASASPADMSKRQGLEIKSADFYHFKTSPADPANGVSERMANEQALSLAKFEGNHESKYFWFLEKNPAFKGKRHVFQDGKDTIQDTGDEAGDPGAGCQVVLYFDNILERLNKADELDWNYNATDKVEDKWAVAGGITPWCSKTFMPKDNAEYRDTDLGFISTRPSEEYDSAAFVMLTYLRDESQGQDDTIVADQVNIVWSGKVLNWITRVYPPNSVEDFKAAVNATYNPIVNPYKYGKADPIWSKVKPDNLFEGQ